MAWAALGLNAKEMELLKRLNDGYGCEEEEGGWLAGMKAERGREESEGRGDEGALRAVVALWSCLV